MLLLRWLRLAWPLPFGLAFNISAVGGGCSGALNRWWYPSTGCECYFSSACPLEKLTRVQGINQTLNSVLLLLSPAVGE